MLEPDIRAKVDTWLNGNYDEQTKAEIRTLLAENEEELVNSFYKDLEFGTGGLRGIMGVGSNKMNKYTVGAATQGLANYLRQSFPGQEIKVAVAHDSRNNSALFARITAGVFAANGIRVFLFDSLRPTPELSFTIRHLGCQSGVVLTASHNPKEYNGYKAYWIDGGQLVPPHDRNVIQQVKAIQSIDEVKFEGNEHLIEAIGAEVDEAYIRQLVSLSISPEAIAAADLKIVYTSIHGTGITLVPKVLERFGFKDVTIVAEQATPDGNFPTVVYPNPEEAEALSIGVRKAEELGADLLLGTDPDADRVGIAIRNPEGKFQLLNGNQTASLLFYYILNVRRQKGLTKASDYIAKTIVTTDLLDEIATRNGVRCFNTLTGFKYIAEVIREQEAEGQFIVGGEESYGYLVGSAVRDKDAVASVAMICEMAAYAKSQGRTLYDFLLDIYTEYGCYQESLISLTKKGKSGAEEIKAMMNRLRETPPAAVNGVKLTRIDDYENRISRDLLTGEQKPIALPKSDVLQFFFADGSKVSARPSGTEPKIKFYFSVNTPMARREDYPQVSQVLNAKVQSIIEEMDLK